MVWRSPCLGSSSGLRPLLAGGEEGRQSPVPSAAQWGRGLEPSDSVWGGGDVTKEVTCTMIGAGLWSLKAPVGTWTPPGTGSVTSGKAPDLSEPHLLSVHV